MRNTWWLLVSLGSTATFGQTLVDLRTQAKSVDFSGANTTKPFKTGTLLPATCSVGEMYYKVDAPSGGNLYGCTALNAWSAQGGLAQPGGDLSGSIANAVVTQLQTRAVAPTAPSAGQFLGWNAQTNRWEPTTPPSAGSNIPSPAGNLAKFLTTDGAQLFWTTPIGDVSGTLAGLTVKGLQGRSVAPTQPATGQVLTWNGNTGFWEPQTSAGGTGTQGPAGPQGPVGPQGPAGPQGTTGPQGLQGPAGPSGSGSGSGATSTSQLLDFAVLKTNANTLTVGASCSPTVPCSVRFGGVTYAFTSGATVSLFGGSGTAYFYVTSSGMLTVGHNLSLSCASGCVAQSGTTAFPADSLPLFMWTATNGTWDPAGLDQRAFLSTRNVVGMLGITTTDNQGQTQIAPDPAVISLRVGVPATAASACSGSSWATDGSYFYLCTGTNQWRRTGLASW